LFDELQRKGNFSSLSTKIDDIYSVWLVPPKIEGKLSLLFFALAIP
jgi:hypothetical protein